MKNSVKRFCSLLLCFLFVISALPSVAFAQGDLSDAEITINGSYTYTGAAITPNITVTLQGVTLTKGADYTVSCRDNIDAGTATVTVTGIGAYSGQKEADFTIAKASRNDAPPPPTLSFKAPGGVVLNTLPGMEYSTGNFLWSDWGTFDTLIEGGHTFYARYAETDNYFASPRSEPFYVYLDPVQPCAQGQIPQPTNIQFNGLLLEWRQVAPEGADSDWDGESSISIWFDGSPVQNYNHDIIGDIEHLWIDEAFEESGTYEIHINITDFYNEFDPSETVICYYYYVKPGASISRPTNPQWSVEGSDIYMIAVDNDNDDKELGWWKYMYEVAMKQGDGSYSTVYLHWTDDMRQRCATNLLSDKIYAFRVRAFSGDMGKWTHSDWSEWSAPLNLGEEIVDVVQALNDLIESMADDDITAQQALDTIKTLDKDKLKLAMQSNSGLLEMVKYIEEAYLEEKEISTTILVSDWIADKLEGPVSVVGAGLNSSGSDVTLSFDNKYYDVEIESRYVNYVQLSIKMDGVEDSSDLEVPIRITMPIPKPLSVNRLIIMHYTNAGTYESVAFTVNGDGTISFTVTHLSEFVFAEEPAVTPGTGLNVGHAPEIPGNNTITTPKDSPPVAGDDGNIILPGGGTVETPGGVVIDVPAGTTIDKNGTISIPEGKEAEMTLPGGTKIPLPGGSTISGSGNATLGGGAQVNMPDGSTLKLPRGSTISGAGHITVGPGGATVTKGGLSLNITEDTLIIIDDDTPLNYLILFDNPFADVAEGSWYYDYVGFVYSHGLFKGISDSSFSPATPMTRAMLATVLARLGGADLEGFSGSRFADVEPGTWYTQSVEWAAETGIVTGSGSGKFDPGASVTREQLALMLYNFAISQGFTLPTGAREAFADENNISSWAQDAVYALQTAGVVSGKPGNNFDPKGEASRAEVAAMLQRFVELVMGR